MRVCTRWCKMITMRKRLPLFVLLLVLALAVCVHSAAAEGAPVLEDKRLYEQEPLYIDLDLGPDNADDGNFVVMQSGAAILYAASDMSMSVAEDKTVFTLYNPSGEARDVLPGTPVAYVDVEKQQAFFFLPNQVLEQSDRIVFTCNPQEVEPEQLFYKVGLTIDKTVHFSQNIDIGSPIGNVEFSGTLSGDFHIKASCGLTSVSVESWVDYNLLDAVLELDENFSQEIPIAKIPIGGVPGVGLEIGVGLGIFAEGNTQIDFSLTGGRAGFKAEGSLFKKPNFQSLAKQASIDVKQIIADGDVEVNLTLGPSIDLLSVFGTGCDAAEGIAITAELKGDEGGRGEEFSEDGLLPINPNRWHVCKELSCLQGEIDALAKLEVWAQACGHVWSASYNLFDQKLSDFHYSFTFDEFELKPCSHYLNLVDVLVRDTADTPMENVTVTYTDVPLYADRKGLAYIRGTTDEDGYVHLYMPEGDVKITATSWQKDPDDPSGEAYVKKTVDYKVAANGHSQEAVLEIPLYHYVVLVYFEENAKGEPVENMPNAFWVEENHTGTIPNEVPRREGYQFVGWTEDPQVMPPHPQYFPGALITVENKNIELYALWTKQYFDDFRTINYIPNGENVILADNPQIYRINMEGFPLISPVRENYIFTGWTCDEIGLADPERDVIVQCTDPIGKTDYVNRIYVANWRHIPYNVIWRNWDGSLLDISRDVEFETLPVYAGPAPVRPSDGISFYTFTGWTPEITKVTADAEYTAVYTAYPLLKVSSPEDQVLRPDEMATFAVSFTGGEAKVTCQWYVIPAGQSGEPSAGVGTAISGATGDTLTFTATESMSGNRYYCIVQDSVGQKVVSEAAVLTVTRTPLVLVKGPQDVISSPGSEAVFSVEVTGGEQPLGFQWYVIPARSKQAGLFAVAYADADTAVDGADTDTLRVTTAVENDGNRYYCVVWDRVGQKITTEPALLSVLQPMELPHTGDHTSLWLLLAAAAASGAVLIAIWRRRC